MTKANRDPGRDTESGRGAAEPDSSTWAYYDFGTGDSYKQIFAAVFDYFPEPNNVLGETRIFDLETGRVSFPVVTVDPKAIALATQQSDADTIRGMQVRMEHVYAQQLRNAVADGGCPSEILARIQQCFTELLCARLLLAVFYGVPSDSAVPSS
jgi:hypothetical protein